MSKSVTYSVTVALDSLSRGDFIRFKYKLSEMSIFGFGLIENEGTLRIAHMLVDKFTEANSIAVTAMVLREIDLRDKAEKLQMGVYDRDALKSGIQSILALAKLNGDIAYYHLVLDLDTAHRHLSLSAGNREVTHVRKTQPYPDNPERFERWVQVLCTEGLSGRCYWEAEWSGETGVDIAVAYKEISRKGKGNDSALGYNEKSWSLRCTPFGYTFWHNNESTELPFPLSSSRIGVYLDHKAGTLSFYSVSDTMTLLHRVQTKFTRPLYPGFGVGVGSSVKL